MKFFAYSFEIKDFAIPFFEDNILFVFCLFFVVNPFPGLKFTNQYAVGFL